MQATIAEKDFGSSDSPMARAIEWIAEQERISNGPQYVLISNEKWSESEQRGYRSYCAISRKLFLYNYVRQRNWHAYEILPAGKPVRLYCDFEFYRTQSVNANVDGTSLVRRFLDAMLGDLGKLHGLERSGMREILMDSSKETKFSQHVVVQMAPNDQVAWADTVACGEFVTRVAEKNRAWLELPNPNHAGGKPELFVDLSVYSQNHSFRLLGSSKITEPQRVIRLLGSAIRKRLTEAQMESSLIVVPTQPSILLGEPMSLGKRMRDSSDTNLRRSTNQLRRSVSASSSLDLLLDNVESLCHLSRKSIKSIAERGEVQVETYSNDCPIANRTHRNATVFFVVNLYTRRWRIGCHHGECFRKSFQWHPLPAHVGKHSDAAAKELMGLEPLGDDEVDLLLE